MGQQDVGIYNDFPRMVNSCALVFSDGSTLKGGPNWTAFDREYMQWRDSQPLGVLPATPSPFNGVAADLAAFKAQALRFELPGANAGSYLYLSKMDVGIYATKPGDLLAEVFLGDDINRPAGVKLDVAVCYIGGANTIIGSYYKDFNNGVSSATQWNGPRAFEALCSSLCSNKAPAQGSTQYFTNPPYGVLIMKPNAYLHRRRYREDCDYCTDIINMDGSMGAKVLEKGWYEGFMHMAVKQAIYASGCDRDHTGEILDPNCAYAAALDDVVAMIWYSGSSYDSTDGEWRIAFNQNCSACWWGEPVALGLELPKSSEEYPTGADVISAGTKIGSTPFWICADSTGTHFNIAENSASVEDFYAVAFGRHKGLPAHDYIDMRIHRNWADGKLYGSGIEDTKYGTYAHTPVKCGYITVFVYNGGYEAAWGSGNPIYDLWDQLCSDSYDIKFALDEILTKLLAIVPSADIPFKVYFDQNVWDEGGGRWMYQVNKNFVA